MLIEIAPRLGLPQTHARQHDYSDAQLVIHTARRPTLSSFRSCAGEYELDTAHSGEVFVLPPTVEWTTSCRSHFRLIPLENVWPKTMSLVSAVTFPDCLDLLTYQSMTGLDRLTEALEEILVSHPYFDSVEAQLTYGACWRLLLATSINNERQSR